MGRPSMAAQRVEEILDALELCIIDNGIQTTSLENIADKAGFKRTILRHYIGNRDDIICALSKRWSKIYTAQWQELMAWLPSSNKSSSLIDSIFTLGSKDRLNNTIIGEAIFSEAKRLEPIKQDQELVMAEFIACVSQTLASDYPEASEYNIDLVSHGIYANYLMAESLLPLKLVDQIQKLKQSSKLLCKSLTI